MNRFFIALPALFFYSLVFFRIYASSADSLPEITRFEDVSAHVESDVAYVLRAPLPATEWHIGITVFCNPHSPDNARADVHFLGFPEDRRPVQLMVAAPNRDIERFGHAVSGGTESGFHTPQIRGRQEVRRFLNAALVRDAIITNGWRVMVNRVNPKENQSIRQHLLDCLS